MHYSGGGNELVGRIAFEVEAGGGSGDREVQRPYVLAGDDALDIAVVQIDVDSPKFSRPGEFPRYDGGDTPSILSQEVSFSLAQLSAQSVEEHMRVKIEHRGPWISRWIRFRHCP